MAHWAVSSIDLFHFISLICFISYSCYCIYLFCTQRATVHYPGQNKSSAATRPAEDGSDPCVKVFLPRAVRRHSNNYKLMSGCARSVFGPSARSGTVSPQRTQSTELRLYTVYYLAPCIEVLPRSPRVLATGASSLV